MAAAPTLSPEVFRAHDAVVRGLARTVDAVIPARFGMLARTATALHEALARVTGREQMILRVYASSGKGIEAPPGHAPPLERADAPGMSYLAERARAHRAAREVRELAPLRPVLDRFVSAERVERHAPPPLLASVYHLVARGAGDAYAKAVAEAASRLRDVRVTVSGPWAAYAFAPESFEE